VRAIAACSIVVFHVWLFGDPNGRVELGPIAARILPHLSLGVTLFFTLSGFLLYRPYAAAILSDQPLPSVRMYAANRLLRIFPAYWTILLITGIVLGAVRLRMGVNDLVIGSLVTQPRVLLENALLLQGYRPGAFLTGIGPAWSLIIELAFYAVLPLLALTGAFTARRSRAPRANFRGALLPPLCMLGVGVAGRGLSLLLDPNPTNPGWAGDWHSVLIHSLLGKADLFCWGMLLAVLHVHLGGDGSRLPRMWRIGALAGAGMLTLLAVAVAGTIGTIRWHAYDMTMGFVCALVLAAVVLARQGSWLVWALELRVVTAVGLASYSLFLWHEPLIWWLREHELTWPEGTGMVLNLGVVGALSGTASALSYFGVERPILRRKRAMPTADRNTAQ